MTRKGGKKGNTEELQILRKLGWVLLLGLLLFLTASLVTFNPADHPGRSVWPLNEQIHNACGRAGALIAFYSFEMIGVGAFMPLVGLAVFLIVTARGARVSHPALRMLGLLIMACAIAAGQNLVLPRFTSFPEGSGGLLGITATFYLQQHFGWLGTLFVILAALAIGAIVSFDTALAGIPRVLLPAAAWIGHAFLSLFSFARDKAIAYRDRPRNVRLNDLDDDERVQAMRDRRPLRGRAARRAAAAAVATASQAQSEAAPEENETGKARHGVHLRKKKRTHASRPQESETTAQAEEKPQNGPVKIDREALKAKIAKLPIKHAGSNRPAPVEDDDEDDTCSEPVQVQDLSGYRFPSLDELEDPETSFSDRMREFVKDQAQALEEALITYGIDGEVVGIDSGPVITMYEVKLAPGTKVANINSVSSDIARALGAINIRVVPNIPGKTTVGIEVPNLEKEKVRLKELMLACTNASRMKLPMFLGKDASGAPITQDLTKMPHMLIAGTTGSGKSVCMNSIIMSFLFTRRPDELKLVLVDPKMVEMSQFRDIPHLMCPVVTEMSKATAILEWAVNKMDERYELLARAGCRDISTYNSLSWEELCERFEAETEEQQARIPRQLPYMVFVVDELADLIMTNKDVEHSIVRIAQKARAVGIHLILATQRPQANVVTGLIKSNMPCRIAFKVSSGMDSRIVLDQKGAELLLGQGDMLFLSPRSHELRRCQGTLVDDHEIRRVVKFLKTISTQSFERQLVQIRSEGSVSSDDVEITGKINEKDPLFEKAVEMVIASGRGSVSMLQRSLSIGYTRASRLIEQMGQAGIIGEYKGSQARDVVMTIEEWEEMKRLIAQEEKEGTLFSGTEESETEGSAVALADPPEDEEATEAVAHDEEDEDWDYDDLDDDDDDLDEEDEDEEDEEFFADDLEEEDDFEDDIDEDDFLDDEDDFLDDEEFLDKVDDEAATPAVYVENIRSTRKLNSSEPFNNADEIQ